MPSKDKRPNRAAALFEQLFERDQTGAIERLSSGIAEILGNAAALLDEAAMLATARRFERAEFLIATGQEEMGKAYILADMCRVDLVRRQDVLRRLCRMFYDHVLKHAYFDLSAHQYPGIRELEHVQEYFRVSAREWWPGSLEDGEPDMPRDTYFLREANLYVDFDGFSGTWTVPRQPAKSMLFEAPFETPLESARAALTSLHATQELGLFRAAALRIFNGRMKQLVITEKTQTCELAATHEQIAKDLETTLGVTPSAFKDSQLHNWPLYWIAP